MKVNAIIAEYNPFHNGHQYHLEEAKKATGADYTVVVMSGNFVQRGIPAIINKYDRTEMALRNGADLVLELPMYYAVSSAEYFAMGAVSLLDKLGVVDHICFGSECGNLAILQQIAQILLEEPEPYIRSLRQSMRQGLSYPAARNGALLQYAPSLSNHRDVLSSPNNILGIEYLKALLRRGSQITATTTKRVGADYRDIRLGEKQSSALAIRHAIFSHQNTEFLKEQMPESAYEIIMKTLQCTQPVHPNDFSAVMHYKLLTEATQDYTQYLDVSQDLSDRISKNLYQYESFKGFCDLLKSKDMTYTRISRCLLHIMLDMKTDILKGYQETDYISYARVLGFRRDAQPLLGSIKECASIPLVTKLADTRQTLKAEALQMLERDIFMNSIYESVVSLKAKQPMRNEYSTPLVIV
ncbi:MAG: nucleotidyltransferase [Lachnospiraceae bacterium]|nr:nucleotidyltransferase [Lachnospiraceae bacterium]